MLLDACLYSTLFWLKSLLIIFDKKALKVSSRIKFVSSMRFKSLWLDFIIFSTWKHIQSHVLTFPLFNGFPTCSLIECKISLSISNIGLYPFITFLNSQKLSPIRVLVTESANIRLLCTLFNFYFTFTNHIFYVEI